MKLYLQALQPFLLKQISTEQILCHCDRWKTLSNFAMPPRCTALPMLHNLLSQINLGTCRFLLLTISSISKTHGIWQLSQVAICCILHRCDACGVACLHWCAAYDHVFRTDGEDMNGDCFARDFIVFFCKKFHHQLSSHNCAAYFYKTIITIKRIWKTWNLPQFYTNFYKHPLNFLYELL